MLIPIKASGYAKMLHKGLGGRLQTFRLMMLIKQKMKWFDIEPAENGGHTDNNGIPSEFRIPNGTNQGHTGKYRVFSGVLLNWILHGLQTQMPEQ